MVSKDEPVDLTVLGVHFLQRLVLDEVACICALGSRIGIVPLLCTVQFLPLDGAKSQTATRVIQNCRRVLPATRLV